MWNRKPVETDIAKQPYKGPGPTVAGIGAGALQAKFLTISGFFAGGIAAAMFPEKASAVISHMKGALTRSTQSEYALVKFLSKIGNTILDVGTHTSNFLLDLKFVKNRMNKLNPARLEAAVDGAIFGSAGASILGLFTGGTTGVRAARAGKKQVQDLQQEVTTLRDEGDDLRKKLIDTQSELDAEKTSHAKTHEHHATRTHTEKHKPEAAWAEGVMADKAAAKAEGLSL